MKILFQNLPDSNKSSEIPVKPSSQLETVAMSSVPKNSMSTASSATSTTNVNKKQSTQDKSETNSTNDVSEISRF